MLARTTWLSFTQSFFCFRKKRQKGSASPDLRKNWFLYRSSVLIFLKASLPLIHNTDSYKRFWMTSCKITSFRIFSMTTNDASQSVLMVPSPSLSGYDNFAKRLPLQVQRHLRFTSVSAIMENTRQTSMPARCSK